MKVALIVAAAVVAAVFIIWLAARLLKRAIALQVASIEGHGPRPCYRCAGLATKEFMGLRYCFMCREMVMRVYPAAKHDPPFGFPGSTGYLEFPKEEQQKPAADPRP